MSVLEGEKIFVILKDEAPKVIAAVIVRVGPIAFLWNGNALSSGLVLIADEGVAGLHCRGFQKAALEKPLKEGQSLIVRGFANTKDNRHIYVATELTYIHDHYDYFMAVVVPASKERELFGTTHPYPGRQAVPPK